MKDKKSWEEYKKRLNPYTPNRWFEGWDVITDDKLQFPIKEEQKGKKYHERDFALVLRPDIKAMEWIKENTPIDAKFLVEGFRIYGGTSAVGSDAGWWIPLLTGRKNSMPPQYALLNEIPIDPGYSQDVVDLVTMLEESSLNSDESLQLLCKNMITHIFIGQRQGKVGAGATQLFSPKIIAENPAYKLIYREDRVHIYEIDPNLCSQDI